MQDSYDDIVQLRNNEMSSTDQRNGSITRQHLQALCSELNTLPLKQSTTKDSLLTAQLPPVITRTTLVPELRSIAHGTPHPLSDAAAQRMIDWASTLGNDQQQQQQQESSSRLNENQQPKCNHHSSLLTPSSVTFSQFCAIMNPPPLSSSLMNQSTNRDYSTEIIGDRVHDDGFVSLAPLPAFPLNS
jgi:hypothetical protein